MEALPLIVEDFYSYEPMSDETKNICLFRIKLDQDADRIFIDLFSATLDAEFEVLSCT